MKIDRIPGCSMLLVVVCLAATSVLSGCTVKLISSYDETTDRTVTALQRKTEAHLFTLETVEGLPECTYDHHKPFYDEARVDISAITVRAAAIPKNEITTKETILLSNNLENFEKLHKIACLSKDQITLLRTHFNSSFTAILKLELAKRRGD